jgi:tetratricopeptide (TPR) repeat protein
MGSDGGGIIRISLFRSRLVCIFLAAATFVAVSMPIRAQQQPATPPAPEPSSKQQAPSARSTAIAESYSGVSIQPSLQIFATMSALDAAGFPSDESPLVQMPNRRALREDLLKMNGPATEALRKFYKDHQLGDAGENLSRYMAFALVAGPPPKFQFEVPKDLLPPDVISLEGFQELLANFYEEAHLDARWAKVEREYDYAALDYGLPVNKIITVANAYLREVAKPSKGRSFYVFVEPLVGKRTIFRNTGDRYAIIVGLTPDFPDDEIRHAYLHFLLDPLPLQNRGIIMRKSVLLASAAKAPHLPPEYQSDFLALTDECFIKAVDLRMQHMSADQLAAALTDADRSGYILVRPIVTQLLKFEKAEPAMSYYFTDLIDAIDVPFEQRRAQRITFYPADVIPGASAQTAQNSQTDIQQLMDQGDRYIALQNAAGAEAVFQKVLNQDPNQPRATYGLAIASVLQGKAAIARDLFEKVVAAGAPGTTQSAATPDPNLLAWSHIYLGRIHDLEGEREQAVGEYQAALAVSGVPDSAKTAAQRGVQVAYAPQTKSGAAPPPKP